MRRFRVGFDPGLSRIDHRFGSLDQFVDQADFKSLGRLAALPLKQDLHQCLLQAKHTDGAHHATATWQQSQSHFRQADFTTACVKCHSVVARQRQLKSATECGTVDGGDDWFAQRLQPAQVRLHGCRRRFKLRGICLGDVQEDAQVSARKEHLLSTGQDHA